MRGQRESLSTRDAFGKALAEKSEEYPNLVYLAADTLKSVGGTEMHCRYPNRALNIGISEQNMALMGAGLAASGAKVVLASYAVFSTLRILEQIRTFIAYPGLDVKIVAGLSGLSGGQEGVTHQGIEDIACLRSIPGLTIVAPADAASTMAITRTIIDYQGPVYMRLGRTPTEQIFETGYCFTMGKANLLQDGTGCTIIAAGLVMGRVLKAAELLQTAGYGSVRVFRNALYSSDRPRRCTGIHTENKAACYGGRSHGNRGLGQRCSRNSGGKRCRPIGSNRNSRLLRRIRRLR